MQCKRLIYKIFKRVQSKTKVQHLVQQIRFFYAFYYFLLHS